MSMRHDWSEIPSPAVLVAGLAVRTAMFAAVGLTPRHAPEPALVAHDDGGGSSFVLDLSGPSPVLVLVDHDERGTSVAPGDVLSGLGLAALPGLFAGAGDLTGAARWDGERWAPALGVPGQVIAGVADDKRVVGSVDDALGEFTECAIDDGAVLALLTAVRAGAWDERAVEAALRAVPYDDEEPAGEPDKDAARAVLDGFAAVLRRAGS